MVEEAPCETATHEDRHLTKSHVHRPGRRKPKSTKTPQSHEQQQQQWQWTSAQGARTLVATAANSDCSGDKCRPLKLNGVMEGPAFTHPDDSHPNPPSLSRSQHSSAVIEDTPRGDARHEQEPRSAQVAPGPQLATVREIALQARLEAIGYVCGDCQAGMAKRRSGCEMGFPGRHSRGVFIFCVFLNVLSILSFLFCIALLRTLYPHPSG